MDRHYSNGHSWRQINSIKQMSKHVDKRFEETDRNADKWTGIGHTDSRHAEKLTGIRQTGRDAD